MLADGASFDIFEQPSALWTTADFFRCGFGMLRRKFVSAQNWTSPEIIDYLSKL